jgi:transcriptional regulator with XRE-family HTH domain
MHELVTTQTGGEGYPLLGGPALSQYFTNLLYSHGSCVAGLSWPPNGPGSGGHLLLKEMCLVKTTGGVRFSSRRPSSETSSRPQLTEPRDQLSSIKEHLGLSVSDLAAVLHVRRPTIYHWLSGGALRPRNRKRLDQIHQITVEWHQISDRRPGNYLHARICDGKSLLDLLKDDIYDMRAIRTVLRTIKEELVRYAASKSKPSISDRLEELGFEKPSAEDRREALHRISSKVTDQTG